MEYAEFWLLESVVRWVVPLGLIAGDDRFLRLQWNKPPHHLNRAELARLLRRLLKAGYVKCSLGDEEVTPTDEELITALDYAHYRSRGMAPALCYALTTEGAQRWEQYAQPNWARYYEDVEPDEGIREITAGSAEMLGYLLEVGPLYWEMIVLGGAEDRIVLEPWHATYWKTLPQGHRVTLQFVDEPLPSDPESYRTWRAEKQEQSAHRKRVALELRNWYTRFEPPNAG